MSSDIYDKPDVSRKVRQNRRVEEDGEWEEREVQIYETADDVRDDPTGFQSEEGGPHSQNHPPVQRKPLRGAAVCLGVLCLLMMVGIISLSIRYVSVTLGIKQLKIRNNNLSSSYSLLEKKTADMAANNSQLQEEVKKLKDKTEDVSLTLEIEQLKIRINNLSSSYNQSQNDLKQLQEKIHNMAADNSQLQEEVKKLKDKTEGKWCPEGWTRFGCSCYFESTQEQWWYESRSDCLNKGADLVSINSKEEQEFVTKLNVKGQSWIGLWTVQEGWTSTWKWKWVDGSALTETFWATGHGKPTSGHYGSCCDQQGTWTQSYYYDSKKTWICEKKIS
ncbi:low affinity immunoglobulin epsilon Fc receptor-like [Mastacembelus armatus]|uniref:low affinity immunoglobulin epsilon Fc receptor-like n=1 Tax=Mastacembelus armatus TaxID=205130 RepID=UPI001436C1BE|nr:low affinity immunoglobulin epsilon Fc receptor-like [Mastacembelus armatus]